MLAGSFSAKESFAKALGQGFRDGLKFSHIEIIRKENKRPYFRISDNVKLLLQKKLVKYKNYDLSLSISHNHKTVVSHLLQFYFLIMKRICILIGSLEIGGTETII